MHAPLEVAGDAFEGLRVVLRRGVRPRADRTLGEAPPLVVDHQIGVEIELRAEPVAGRAGAERVVEREQPRLDLRDREPGNRAGELRGKDRLLAQIGVLGDGDSLGEIEGRLERIGEPVAEIGGDDDPIDDDRDVVLQVLVERPDLVELQHLAVDLDPLKAALPQIDEFLAVFALAPARDRGEQIEPRSLRHRHDPVDHLRDGLADDRQSGRRRIRAPRPAPRGAACSRRSRSPSRPSSAGCATSSSARSRSPATGPRSIRPRASASVRGTALHTPTGSRHSGAGPRHRSCRRRATTCPSPTARSSPPGCRAAPRHRRSSDCARAPRESGSTAASRQITPA